MKLKLLLVLFFLSSQANASFWMECHFKAELQKEEQGLHFIKLKKVLKAEGHDHNCAKFLGNQKVSLKDIKRMKDKSSFNVKYYHYDGMGPKGVVSSTTWTVLKEEDQDPEAESSKE